MPFVQSLQVGLDAAAVGPAASRAENQTWTRRHSFAAAVADVGVQPTRLVALVVRQPVFVDPELELVEIGATAEAGAVVFAA